MRVPAFLTKFIFDMALVENKYTTNNAHESLGGRSPQPDVAVWSGSSIKNEPGSPIAEEDPDPGQVESNAFFLFIFSSIFLKNYIKWTLFIFSDL